MKLTDRLALYAYIGAFLLALGSVLFKEPLWLSSFFNGLPVIILFFWFYTYTASRRDSWLRIAMLASISFCILGDLMEVSLANEQGVIIYIHRACYIGSYAFIAAGFFAKSTLKTGYLRRSPGMVIFITSHLILLILLWPYIIAVEFKEMLTKEDAILYSGFLLTAWLSIANIRNHVPEKHYWGAFSGFYLLVLNEAMFIYSGEFQHLGAKIPYLVGQVVLTVSVARIVRHERSVG